MDLNDIDPDIRRFVAAMRDDWKQFPPFDTMSFPQQRAAAEKVRARWRQGGPAMAQTQDLVVDPGAGELRLRIHRPVVCEAALPALIYIHGGGFTLFSIDTHDRLMREYAARGGFAVIGVDYPLAPEAKYPVALDRIEALVLWLRRNGHRWKIDPLRLALGGDSAGGNLSFATCLRLRERGELAGVQAVLSNYGGFSPRISDAAEARFGGPGSIMDRAEAQQYWANYLRSDADADDPQACPILADLRQFPPVLLVVPELDIVAEDSLTMHQKLKAAGVPVRCRVYPGAVHSFLEAMSISALASQAIDDGARFIARHLAPA
jgi:acetyl esterase